MSKVTLDNRRLNNLIREVPDNVEEFIKSVGFSIEREAKIRAPVDTGALRNSIYTQTKNSNTRVSESDYELPRGTKSKIYVGPTMDYAIIQEFGSSNQNAQPYLIPALQLVARQLSEHYRILID